MKAVSSRRGRKQSGGFLEGQLLIAMPTMMDKRFARSVIYMCAHSSEGAMGLIINQRADNITFPSLLKQLNLIEPAGEEAMPPDMLSMSVHVGGPVEKGRGFVLHTGDYTAAGSTMRINGGVCLTATLDILKAMAEGRGPGQAILALGYAGWSAGQLENEIQANGWLNCAADKELVFDPELEHKYDRALSKLGIELSHLVADCGHA